MISKDERAAFAIESFGFEVGGVLELTVKELQLLVLPDYERPDEGQFRIAFVLTRSQTDATIRLEDTTSTQEICFHESIENNKDGNKVLYMNDRREQWKEFHFQETINEKGDYHLYFSNCEPNTQINFQLHLVEYNMLDGTTPMYLSAGEASLPTWYFVLSALFLGELVLWASLMLRGRTELKQIHWLMLATIVTKFISLVLQSLKYHYAKWHGVHNGWFVAYYIFAALKGLLMFCVIVLIGTGWSYMKPFLTERDKHLMLAVIVAQAMLNIAMVVVGETAPGSEAADIAKKVFFFLDLICCCLILLPIVWSIKHLRQAAGVDNKDERLNRNLERLRRFRTFYLVTVAFVYFTRIIVFLLESTLPFEITWMAYVFSETASLLFYAATGVLFAPGRKNPYISLAVDDDDSPENKYDHRGKGHLVDIQADNGHTDAPLERL